MQNRSFGRFTLLSLLAISLIGSACGPKKVINPSRRPRNPYANRPADGNTASLTSICAKRTKQHTHMEFNQRHFSFHRARSGQRSAGRLHASFAD